jgi:hypothetical protein
MLSHFIENIQVMEAENNFLEGCICPMGSMLASPDIDCVCVCVCVCVCIMSYLWNAGHKYKTS